MAKRTKECLQWLGKSRGPNCSSKAWSDWESSLFSAFPAQIDGVFNALADGGPRLIVCRHEQNAAFMAGCVGRLTGKPGVVLVTSGPGVANLATGMLTATTEGDPLVAIGGSVPRSMKLKQTHQNLNNVDFARPVAKCGVEVDVPESIPEIVENAFRTAARPRGGAAFISLPQDVAAAPVDDYVCPAPTDNPPGPAANASIDQAAKLLQQAKQPALLLGRSVETGKRRRHSAVAGKVPSAHSRDL